MPDNLTVVAGEIKALLKKHDLAGMVFLASPTNAEFIYEFCPTWSCAYFDLDGEFLRFRAGRGEYPVVADRVRAIADTAGMLDRLRTSLGGGMRNLDAIIRMHGELFAAPPAEKEP